MSVTRVAAVLLLFTSFAYAADEPIPAVEAPTQQPGGFPDFPTMPPFPSFPPSQVISEQPPGLQPQPVGPEVPTAAPEIPTGPTSIVPEQTTYFTTGVPLVTVPVSEGVFTTSFTQNPQQPLLTFPPTAAPQLVFLQSTPFVTGIPGLTVTGPTGAPVATPQVIPQQPGMTANVPVFVAVSQTQVYSQTPNCAMPSGQTGYCVAPSFCMAHDTNASNISPCTYTNQSGHPQQGICCSKSPFDSEISVPTEVYENSTKSFMNKEEYDNKKAIEQNIFEKGVKLPSGTAESRMQSVHQTEEKALRMSQAVQQQHVFQSRGRLLEDELTCPRPQGCVANRFRTIDGSCNNLKHGEWGMAMRGFTRLLPQKYDDERNLPRSKCSDGSPLPLAREIVSQVFHDGTNSHPSLTVWLMQWGQIVAHDTTLTAISKGKNGDSISCCPFRNKPELYHPNCLHMPIPRTDPFYGQFNHECMEFVRSLSSPRPDCTKGPREQMNQVTSFIDASLVYGSTDDDAADLRQKQLGLLKVSRWNNVDLLPFDHNNTCSKPKKNVFCYKTGDFRVNMTPDLTAVQTIMVRDHNNIARKLHEINPGWDDERLYQEARKIVGAIIQHITYNEYLPVLLGPDVMKQFDLLTLSKGFGFHYNESVDATTWNVFSTAAFRMGHNAITGTSDLYDANWSDRVAPKMRDEFFRPYRLQLPGYLDKYVRGLCQQGMERFDHIASEEIVNHLFEVGRKFGLDLISFDIQRGRDHGLRPYNEYREVCGQSAPRSWDELTNYLRPQVIDGLRRVYRRVEDIDVFVGGMLERPLKKGNVGPTFACIIAEQFRRWKNGDRFFYENGGFPNSFTLDQLNEIRKVKLSKMLCLNGDGLKVIQPHVFIKPNDSWNRLARCEDLPGINLNYWKEA